MKKTNKNLSRAGAKAAKLPASPGVLSASVDFKNVGSPVMAAKAAPEVSPARPVRAAVGEPRKPAVSLELVKPDAAQVFVAGTFNGWRPEQTPLERRDSGRWVKALALPPGRHEYLFVVDGKWMPDPNAAESVQNPFGGKNSVISVSA